MKNDLQTHKRTSYLGKMRYIQYNNDKYGRSIGKRVEISHETIREGAIFAGIIDPKEKSINVILDALIDANIRPLTLKMVLRTRSISNKLEAKDLAIEKEKEREIEKAKSLVAEKVRELAAEKARALVAEIEAKAKAIIAEAQAKAKAIIVETQAKAKAIIAEAKAKVKEEKKN